MAFDVAKVFQLSLLDRSMMFSSVKMPVFFYLSTGFSAHFISHDAINLAAVSDIAHASQPQVAIGNIQALKS